MLVADRVLAGWPIADGIDVLLILDARTEEGWDTDWARGVDVDMDDDVERDSDATEDESLEKSDNKLPSERR